MGEYHPEHAALMSDFSAWQVKNPGKICCGEQSMTEDGRLILSLSMNDTKFRLLCPANYPDHEDSFFVETECTDFWCVALNEFITDFPGKLRVDDILAKAFLYYTPSSEHSHDSSDNESDNENELQDEDHECTDDSDSSQAAEWESIISKKKREWQAKEGELRLRYNRPKISDMFAGQLMDHPQQFFSNSAASAILINDLINIMSRKDSSGIIVDPVENDICRWSVFLKDFHPDSKISQNLEEIKNLYGYDHIQLQLNFTMDLYPSVPPVLRFVRPKLLGVFDTKCFVKLANWNPARDMNSVLKEIKDYIENYGAIDINNTCNGIKVGIVKEILLELGNHLEVKPKLTLDEEFSASAADKADQSTYFKECLVGSQHATSIPREFYSSAVWKNLKGKDIAIETILSTLLYYLRSESEKLKSTSFESNILAKKYGRRKITYFTFDLALNKDVDENNFKKTSQASGYLMKSKRLQTESRSVTQDKANIPCDRKYCNIITNPSFELGPEPRHKNGLQNEKFSVDNISNTAKTSSNVCTSSRNSSNSVVSSFNYANTKTFQGLSLTSSTNCMIGLDKNLSSVFKTIQESVLLPFIQSKLAVDPYFGIQLSMSLYSKIIEVIIEIASNPHLIQLLTEGDIQYPSIADLLKVQEKRITLILEQLGDISAGNMTKQEDLEKVQLARVIISASQLMELHLTTRYGGNCSDKVLSVSNNVILNSQSDHLPVESLDLHYTECMKDLTYRDCDIDLETHTFKSDYIAHLESSRNYFEIAHELTVLSECLPLMSKSTIFVRTDNTQCSLIQALITGMEGTYCSGGCFTFDIYLTKDYPNCQLEIACTNFPDAGISWCNAEPRSDVSTILQVLTSIQREKLPLNLCDESRTCKEREILISNIIQFAMIDQIRRPPSGFEEVVTTDFLIKKNQILSDLEQYDFLRNSEILDSLKAEFDHL